MFAIGALCFANPTASSPANLLVNVEVLVDGVSFSWPSLGCHVKMKLVAYQCFPLVPPMWQVGC